jgi:hypothetical protein
MDPRVCAFARAPAPPKDDEYAGGEALFLRPLWEKVDRRVSDETDEKFSSTAAPSWNTPHPTSLRSATFSHRGEKGEIIALREA